MRTSRHAFTLMELAIVLTIIGLLIGGVIVGRDMIRSGEINAVIKELRSNQQAVLNFREKYSALPGDMRNATSFWGAADGSTGNTAGCKATPSTDPKTCNGDGDGLIDSSTASYETDRAWQHLANAGFIAGTYSGVEGTSSPWTTFTPVPGVNQLASKLGDNALWLIASQGYTGGSLFQFAGSWNNTFSIWTMNGALATSGSLPLTPTEALQIDSKMDDGLPGTGLAVGFKGRATTPCTDKAGIAVGSDAGAIYNTSNKNKDCLIYFTNAF